MNLLADLPEHLSERTRLFHDTSWNPRKEFVLYWMHHALRAEENPALDVALTLARASNLPLLVYQGLSERYPYASDRHHAMILSGARDAHAALGARRIASVFHLERRGHRGPHLRTLTRRAAVLVTEDMPVQPVTGWIRRLAETCETPIVLADTACVVPMQLTSQFHDRAFAYRDATRELVKQRLKRPWREVEDPIQPFLPTALPFEPVDLNQACFADWIGCCDIDHAIGPVSDTTGGTRAGYARWEGFKITKLANYAKDRNDALRDGVSRMSAYLHYGMVSPLRIAREAADIGGEGAEKYLDELLIWRELAYAFCFFRADHELLSSLPAWAQATLSESANDIRPALIDAETLARGKTDDSLWNAAQRSLLMRGELHNNVRMTWGKALINWTPNAETALKRLIDLNHRYSLDGRDPASYGGLLWCLGQFDRPHTPPQPIFGSVRVRSTKEHSKRLNPLKYMAKITDVEPALNRNVAVIGAGISGLICARTLQDHGLNVTVFDKSHGPGGRTATRRAEPNLRYDHGAQYFTVYDQQFARYVDAWIEQGIVAEWNGRIVEIDGGEVTEKTDQPRRYVGVPGMRAIAEHLATDLEICQETKIVSLTRTQSKWKLSDANGHEHPSIDDVVVALPSPQAADLLGEHRFATQVRAVQMTPCWTALATFERPIGVAWDGAFVHDSPLGWVARNSSKPGRDPSVDSWVLQATPHWSATLIELTRPEVNVKLLAEFAKLIPGPVPSTIHLDAHLWRFSATPEKLDHPALFDPATGVAVCGDWLAGGRVEGAFRSGVAAAGCILREANIPRTEPAK